ncbi:type II methionyl aminopeptidase [Candidatus Woesearchaeota archaeon]|nr:MAG: type II methionyl aminopeptidase [Candidatus Woesearchaeota archaeon]
MAEKDDWLKAGKIAGEVLNYAKSIAKPGLKLIDIAKKVDAKIYELGAKPAFPVNLSLNSVAAHYTPNVNDEKVFNDGDMLKIDVGVQVNGAIGDTALTVGGDEELVKASREALNAAIKEAYAGNEVRMVGKVIQETISSFGFAPVKNLSGHGLSEYVIHSGKTIPNYDNGDQTLLQEGDTIAIEPFATDGDGLVIEGALSNIYRLDNVKPVRDMKARKIVKFVEENYKTLPFARRWLEEKFGNVSFALMLLVREGVLHSYPQLKERSNGMVAQSEHSLYIGDKSVVTTKI